MSQTEIKDILRRRALKVTPIRTSLLQLMTRYNHALPVSVFQKELKSFDRVTLYRTIQTLIEKGLIHKVMVDQEPFYAICQEECTTDHHHHHHVHFKCDSCKEVFCVETPQDISISLPGFKIKELAIEAQGICKDCAV